jgi:hypothetical protein
VPCRRSQYFGGALLRGILPQRSALGVHPLRLGCCKAVVAAVQARAALRVCWSLQYFAARGASRRRLAAKQPSAPRPPRQPPAPHTRACSMQRSVRKWCALELPVAWRGWVKRSWRVKGAGGTTCRCNVHAHVLKRAEIRTWGNGLPMHKIVSKRAEKFGIGTCIGCDTLHHSTCCKTCQNTCRNVLSTASCNHCSVFWPNCLKCDPLLVLSVFSQGVVFQKIRPKNGAMAAMRGRASDCGGQCV